MEDSASVNLCGATLLYPDDPPMHIQIIVFSGSVTKDQKLDQEILIIFGQKYEEGEFDYPINRIQKEKFKYLRCVYCGEDKGVQGRVYKKDVPCPTLSQDEVPYMVLCKSHKPGVSHPPLDNPAIEKALRDCQDPIAQLRLADGRIVERFKKNESTFQDMQILAYLCSGFVDVPEPEELGQGKLRKKHPSEIKLAGATYKHERKGNTYRCSQMKALSCPGRGTLTHSAVNKNVAYFCVTSVHSHSLAGPFQALPLTADPLRLGPAPPAAVGGASTSTASVTAASTSAARAAGGSGSDGPSTSANQDKQKPGAGGAAKRTPSTRAPLQALKPKKSGAEPAESSNTEALGAHGQLQGGEDEDRWPGPSTKTGAEPRRAALPSAAGRNPQDLPSRKPPLRRGGGVEEEEEPAAAAQDREGKEQLLLQPSSATEEDLMIFTPRRAPGAAGGQPSTPLLHQQAPTSLSGAGGDTLTIPTTPWLDVTLSRLPGALRQNHQQTSGHVTTPSQLSLPCSPMPTGLKTPLRPHLAAGASAAESTNVNQLLEGLGIKDYKVPPTVTATASQTGSTFVFVINNYAHGSEQPPATLAGEPAVQQAASSTTQQPHAHHVASAAAAGPVELPVILVQDDMATVGPLPLEPDSESIYWLDAGPGRVVRVGHIHSDVLYKEVDDPNQLLGHTKWVLHKKSNMAYPVHEKATLAQIDFSGGSPEEINIDRIDANQTKISLVFCGHSNPQCYVRPEAIVDTTTPIPGRFKLGGMPFKQGRNSDGSSKIVRVHSTRR